MALKRIMEERGISADSVVKTVRERAANAVTREGNFAPAMQARKGDFVSGTVDRIDFPGGDNVVVTLLTDPDALSSTPDHIGDVHDLTVNELPVAFRNVYTERAPSAGGRPGVFVHIVGTSAELAKLGSRLRTGPVVVNGSIQDGPRFTAFTPGLAGTDPAR